MRDVEPIAGVRAAYEIERAARHVGRDYIRHAREAGHSWHDIGAALNITSGRDRETGAESISEAAFTYATGSPDTDFARRYGRSTREHGAPLHEAALSPQLCRHQHRPDDEESPRRHANKSRQRRP